jgi:hypothetical protein
VFGLLFGLSLYTPADIVNNISSDKLLGDFDVDPHLNLDDETFDSADERDLYSAVGCCF